MQRIPCPLATWAGATPNAPALQSASECLSYHNLDLQVRRAMRFLTDAGVEAGARVALVLPVRHDYVALLWALFRLGAVASPINPAIPADTQRQMAADVACTYWIGADADTCAGAPTDCVALNMAETPHFEARPVASFCSIDREAPCAIVFTSGSTGRAKGALLSFRNLQVNAIRSNRNLPYQSDDCWLLSLPLHHVSGLGVLFRSVIAGAAVALSSPGDSLENSLRQLPVSHVSLVAAQLHRLLQSATGVTRLRALKGILLGGSAIPAALLHRAAVLGLSVHTTYGLTECASQVSATPPGAPLTALLSSGRPLHSGALRIAGDGEILVGGQTLFLGYAQGMKTWRPLSSDSYFATGDLGYLDQAGYLHVTGRIDNRFIAGGENIQPEEIEATLYRYPDVAAAVVVAVPHDVFGNTPVAFIRLKSRRALNAEALQTFLATVLPKFKIPRHFLPWPEELHDGGIKISRRRFAAAARKQLQGH